MSDFTKDIKPGDIINIQGPVAIEAKDFIVDFAIDVGIKFIESTQRRLFASMFGPSLVRWGDNHSMLYLGGGKVFSCQPPKPIIEELSVSDLEPKRIISVYRINPDFFGKRLDDHDLELLNQGAKKILDSKVLYDIAQLFEMLTDTLAGHAYEGRLPLIDGSGKNVDAEVDIETNKHRLVCSVAVAAILSYWRHALWNEDKRDMPQPWTKLNPAAWHQNFIDAYPGHWECGSTFPAMFACSETNFAREFVHIGHYRAGARLW